MTLAFGLVQVAEDESSFYDCAKKDSHLRPASLDLLLLSALASDTGAAAAAVAALNAPVTDTAALPAARKLRARRQVACRAALQALACWAVQKSQLQVRDKFSALYPKPCQSLAPGGQYNTIFTFQDPIRIA